ncbi:MAG: MBG domain-containing protein, partial [Prosthecobacter sp.]|nr:MBG domain-containing protein [Prosthecobacter sp.]
YVTSDFSAYPLDQDEAPVFSDHPSSQTVQVGDAVMMSALATGGGGITYQWYFGDDPIANATEPSLIIASVQFSQSGSYHVVASNLAGSVSGNVATLTVNKRTATLQLASLSQTYNGTSRVVTATTTPANLTVDILYDESATAPTNAGSYAITATIVDDTYQGSNSGTLNVAKASQAITFPAIGSQVATSTVPLSANGGASGNPVTFAVSQGPGSISDGVLSFTGAGNVGVVASQAGNSNYNAAPNLERFVTVTKASAVVNLSALSQTYDGTPRVAGVSTTPANLAVDLLYAGSATAPTAVGDYAVTATINEALYAGSASGTLSVTKAGQVITFAAIPDQTAVDSLPLVATGGGSGNPVTFAVTSGPGSITNGTLSFSGAGQVLITASQAGDSNHEAAADVQRSVNVSKAVGIITLSALNQTYDSTPRQVMVTTEPEGLAVQILYGESDTAPTQAGQYLVTATLNDEFYEGSSSETLVVAKATQVITFAAIPDQLATATLPLVATGGGSVAPVAFAVTAGPGQIAAGSLSFTAAGEVTVTASQEGDDNHEAAADVPRTFTVSRDTVSLTFAQTSSYYDGTVKAVQVTTVPEGLPVQILYDESATLPVEAGDYTVQATVDTALYSAVGFTTLSVLRPQLALEREPALPLLSGISAVDLGSVAPDTASPFTFTIRNAGTGLLSNFVATVTGPDAAQFSIAGPASDSVAAGQATTLDVIFSPQSTGIKNAVLQVASNDFSVPLFTVNLTAFGDHRADRPVMAPETEATLVEAESTLWDEASVGLYDGLLRDAEDEHRLIGAIESLTLAKPKAGSGLGGAATGKLRFQGKSVTLKGTFDEAGLLLLDLPQKDGSVITGSLQLMDSTAGKVIRGHVSWLGQDTLAELPRAAYDKKNPAPANLTGSYTMLLPGPAEQTEDTPSGDGWATVSISSTGAVKVSGRLSDGTAFTESAFLSAEADFSLYTELYKATARGQFGGRMALRDVPDVSDFDGQVQWLKPADAKSVTYPAGFSLELWALGSRYTAPATGERALSQLEDAEPNASLSLISTALPEGTGSEIEHVLSWLPNHKLVHYGPEKLAGSVNRTQGLLTGSYSDPTGSTRLSFLGAVFQKQGLAAGYFLYQGRSGGLRIVPGTDFAYPGSEEAGGMQTLAVAETAETLEQTESLWSAAAAGTYQGILMGESGPQGGLEKLVVNSSGSFSATLWIQGTRYKIKGAFDASGIAEITLADGIIVSLQLALVDGTEDVYQLTGSVTTNAETYLVDAQRLPVNTKTAPSPWAGAYTLAVLAPADNDPSTEPGGDGYGLLKVATSGVCTGSLVLSDGTKSTFAGHVSQGGEWSLYRALYGSKPGGFLAGKLTFRDVAGISDFDGVWQWEKAAGAAAYPGGFALTRNVIGSLYEKPAKGQRAWAELADTDHNVWLRLLGPNFSSVAELTALDRALTWSSADKLTYYGPEKISLTFTSTSGLVTGSVVDKNQGLNQRFAGVLLQKQATVTGAYQTTAGSGRFLMQSREE